MYKPNYKCLKTEHTTLILYLITVQIVKFYFIVTNVFNAFLSVQLHAICSVNLLTLPRPHTMAILNNFLCFDLETGGYVIGIMAIVISVCLILLAGYNMLSINNLCKLNYVCNSLKKSRSNSSSKFCLNYLPFFCSFSFLHSIYW
jgi:hypothetical protein